MILRIADCVGRRTKRGYLPASFDGTSIALTSDPADAKRFENAEAARAECEAHGFAIYDGCSRGLICAVIEAAPPTQTPTGAETMTTQEITAAISSTHDAIVTALDGHEGFAARLSRDGDAVYITRSGRRMGDIRIEYDGDAGIELTAHLTGCRGGINAALRAAGVCDSHWDLS